MPIPPAFAAPVPESRIPPTHRVPSFLSYLLRQVCLGIMAEVLAPADLRPVEYATLTTLDAEPGIDQRHLAARVAIDKMSAGQLIERLEERGLIDRHIDPADRRARLLQLTPKGLALRRRLQPAALAAQDRILAPLQPEERPVLIDLIARVVEGHHVYARPGNGRRGPRKSGSHPT
ncbi:MAG TPA: MarR family winged helix-turn-helix transcriptional regulator [Candidatus Angelobacter sp.]|nr:MarR family winged helix-turn-helix transcriptional regulator [Candidatus Angelobacter sp.]